MRKSITDAQLAEWKALAEKVTPGKWFPYSTEWAAGWLFIASEKSTPTDAAFISAAREVLLACIAEIERLRMLAMKYLDERDVAVQIDGYMPLEQVKAEYDRRKAEIIGEQVSA